jgi:GR25 family glycosyltransferase involved in LPS biosynthesis
MMRAFAITMWRHEGSEMGFKRLQQSWESSKQSFPLKRFTAVTYDDDTDAIMKSHKIKWNYPWKEAELDWASGLLKSPYPTRNPKARIACALSHYALWKKCYNESESILILEHDTVFTKTLNYKFILDSKYDIIGINDPRGATRLSQLFHNTVEENIHPVQRPPLIDHLHIPQGIAGNSAYIMKPSGAKKMLDLVDEYGLWPNDAIMCRQLVPTLGITKEYYTKVLGFGSTTSL